MSYIADDLRKMREGLKATYVGDDIWEIIYPEGRDVVKFYLNEEKRTYSGQTGKINPRMRKMLEANGFKKNQEKK